MKVLFIVTAYPRSDGDVITPWMGETIARLRGAGTHVEVLAPSYKGLRTHEIADVRVHRFRYAPARWETLTHDMPAVERIRRAPQFTGLLPGYVAAGSAAAARVAREGKFDVAHAFWPVPHGLFGIAAKRASGCGLVSTFFSAELTWSGTTRKVIAPVLRKVVSASDVVTVISTYTGNRLREYIPDVRSVTIPFGAAAVDRGDAAAIPSVRRLSGDPFELLFIGRLVERKGVDVLLRAVAGLADERLRVRIVGDGPERERLERLAGTLAVRGRVVFEGTLDAAMLERRLVECDALVLPAIVTRSGDTEGLGVVLIEAMGYAKPVIASGVGGILDIVEDGRTGLLVPPGDPDMLAAAIRGAMDDPDELASIAARGQAFAAEAFGWDSIVGRLVEVYEVAARGRSV